MTTQTETKIHHTIRVAAADTPDQPLWTHNGVAPEDLDDFILAHKRTRPTMALFVDRQCLFAGTLQEDHIERLSKQIAELPWVVDIVTRPYR